MAKRSITHKPQFAEVGDVQEFATTIKSAWVDCRSDGHDMRPFAVELTEAGNFLRTRKCRRCNTKRHQVIDRSGLILHTTVEYAEGYLMPKGTGRLDSEGRGVFRLAALEAEYDRKAARRH